ncbi:MAG: hypothetical protein AB7I18_02375 [Candidatus Berkiella sp.]
MRELTLREVCAVSGGEIEANEPSLQGTFWGTFMYSSGFAAGIFWSPVMPFVMAIAALGSVLGTGLTTLVTGTARGAVYAGTSAYSLVSKE